jgi:dihydroxyacid dehydratase/phosphogluconate dehydratase
MRREWENALAGVETFNHDVIRPREKPSAATGGTVILRGTLPPDGAVIKTSAASPKLLQHKGPAVVFKNYQGAFRWAGFGCD